MNIGITRSLYGRERPWEKSQRPSRNLPSPQYELPVEYFASSITALPPFVFRLTVNLVSRQCPFFTQVFLSFIHHPFLPLLCTTCTLLTLVFKRNEIGHLYLCPFTGVSHIPFLWSGFV